jgi:hypothetical protein
MATGMDANRIIDFLSVAIGYNAGASGPHQGTLASAFTAGTSNLGHVRLITSATPSTAQINGSELSGGGYTPITGITYSTGTAGTFSTPTYSAAAPAGAATSNNAALQQTNMPGPVTIGGIEVWDSAATPLRWWWGALNSPVTVNALDTLVFNPAGINAAITS